ncbi:hypothetical protein [Bacillus paralicheniformis]|uniref:hypothetical protein n=1 Tax=Bacillus paralicheniformis TaxID=1648923 RepID=UPI00203FE639|nr:hypothetical protein [Bacillus paralicheniformis]MCM3425574.1 hypothetical protein [Bacillus paralicheniformis]
MERKSFKDYNGKKGCVGSTVVELDLSGEPTGERKKVKRILGRGAAGTWIYFDKGVGGKANCYSISEDSKGE